MTSASWKPFVDITQAKLKAVGQVRAGGRIVVAQGAAGAQVDIRQAGKPLVQQWSVWFHGVCGTEHRGQLFVLDLDERQCFLRNMRAGGCHRRNGVAFVEGLIGRHNVVTQKAHIVHHAFGQIHNPAGRLRQIL